MLIALYVLAGLLELAGVALGAREIRRALG
jgi:hypothetical protein